MSHLSTFCTCLALTFLISCSRQGKDEKSDEDTLAVEKFPEMEMDSSTSDISQPISILENADTLFNIMARQKLLEGEFMGVTVMTESFIDLKAGRKKRNLLAALIETGVGEYTGGREGSYETTHAVLAVFEQKDEGLSLVAHANVGEGGGYGLKLFTTTAETVSLMPEGEAVMIHSKSSESGAGDYGFRKDDVSIYILLNDAITSVFETTLEDYQFTSDEQTSTAEQTITSEINVLESITKGMYDIRLFTTTVLSGTGDAEEDGGEQDKSDNTPESEPDPGQLYVWDGRHYQLRPN
jgi:hypothetical protein